MQLAAELTCGWQDDPDAPLAASRLHREIASRPGDYAGLLGDALRAVSAKPRILGLDQLFRRRTGGFQPVRQFVGSLASLPGEAGKADTLVCEIDAFAYGFLKGAKNFDFVLPCGDVGNNGFRVIRDDWTCTWKALREFERIGQPLPSSCAVSEEQYLALRSVVVRPSARDERRSLATLLISGPSTRSELSEDLCISDNLSRRTLAALVAIDVVEQREGGLYAIVPAALSLVTFALRETMGLDPLGGLDSGV